MKEASKDFLNRRLEKERKKQNVSAINK